MIGSNPTQNSSRAPSESEARENFVIRCLHPLFQRPNLTSEDSSFWENSALFFKDFVFEIDDNVLVTATIYNIKHDENTVPSMEHLTCLGPGAYAGFERWGGRTLQ